MVDLSECTWQFLTNAIVSCKFEICNSYARICLTSSEDLEGGVPTDAELAAGVLARLCAVHLDEVHRGIVLLKDAGRLLELWLHPLAVPAPRRVEHH